MTSTDLLEDTRLDQSTIDALAPACDGEVNDLPCPDLATWAVHWTCTCISLYCDDHRTALKIQSVDYDFLCRDHGMKRTAFHHEEHL